MRNITIPNYSIIAAIVFLSFQGIDNINRCAGDGTSRSTYFKAYDSISLMLQNNRPIFKNAVFITENAYFDDTLDYNEFDNKIQYLVFWAREQAKSITLKSYSCRDSNDVRTNLAIFMVMRDTCKINVSNKEIRYHLPFFYDFDDFFGKERWTKMFLIKLLATQKGNCHSMPYLYKILSDELAVHNSWLSFAPYHIYIKNHCIGIGWYNTELTSGQFPTDAWVMASGYVSPDAVRSGIYMDTLSNEQAVANCLLDLAKGYERKFDIYTDSFIVKCCDLALRYHPTNINAIIYKAETLKRMYLIYKKEGLALAPTFYSDMEKLYIQALDLGYKEMPEKMYKDWLFTTSKQIKKYSNKNLINGLKIK